MSSPVDDWPRNPENGRLICTPEKPMPKGWQVFGRWEHTNVTEDGDGCFDGCCADYLCKDCEHRWRAELPQ